MSHEDLDHVRGVGLRRANLEVLEREPRIAIGLETEEPRHLVAHGLECAPEVVVVELPGRPVREDDARCPPSRPRSTPRNFEGHTHRTRSRCSRFNFASAIG